MNCSRISPVKVGDLVKDVRNGRIGLPDLQRPFVWKDNKVRELFDSMLKGYPIAEVDFLNRMLSAVRIRNGMDRSSFINHIIYSSGLKDAKESRAGAGALIEIFKSVGVLSEVDGKLLHLNLF